FCPVRLGLSQLLLSLGLLLAGPCLGWGGNARAEYVARFLIASARSQLLVDAPSGCTLVADPAAASSSAGDYQPESRERGRKLLPSSDRIWLLTTLDSAGSTGAGSQQVSSGTSPDSAMTTSHQVEAVSLVGFLFLEEVLRRPPPFPSRIF